jgi:ABC-type lipoprotein release transport system permease subunit
LESEWPSARIAQIQRLVLLDGFRPIFDGLAGILAGIGARLAIRPFVPDPPPLSLSLLDPASLFLVAFAVMLAAFVACQVPARRAARVQPSVALRDL